jgi:hypothetical protein
MFVLKSKMPEGLAPSLVYYLEKSVSIHNAHIAQQKNIRYKKCGQHGSLPYPQEARESQKEHLAPTVPPSPF